MKRVVYVTRVRNSQDSNSVLLTPEPVSFTVCHSPLLTTRLSDVMVCLSQLQSGLSSLPISHQELPRWASMVTLSLWQPHPHLLVALSPLAQGLTQGWRFPEPANCTGTCLRGAEKADSFCWFLRIDFIWGTDDIEMAAWQSPAKSVSSGLTQNPESPGDIWPGYAL